VPFPLYDDENAMERILFGMLVSAGVDCLTSRDAGQDGKSDPDQLAFASSLGRAIVTYDRADFQRLHSQWMRAGRSHAGIIVITKSRVATGVLFSKLMQLQAVHDAQGMMNAILFIGPRPLEEPP
jgi:predicted nuclease of predicted toxin-antitoxin system